MENIKIIYSFPNFNDSCGGGREIVVGCIMKRRK